MLQKIAEPVELEEPGPLVFEWSWGKDEHRIDYQIEVDTDELHRNSTISGSPQEKRVPVAQFIDADLIDWQVSVDDSGDRPVKITIAASVGGCKKAGKTRLISALSGA